MSWLPSLSALRAFEATARLHGFSAAARSLNVTPAAVAQQVRALEVDLGQQLVVRSGRGMRLTPEGARLAGDLAESFRLMTRAVEKSRSGGAAPSLKVACPPALSQSVLMPRLARFWQRHPEITLSLAPASQLTDLRRDGIDIAIRTGTGPWPGHDVRLLANTCFLLVAAPALLARGGNIQDMPWIGPFDSTDAGLIAASGLDIRRLNVIEFASSLLSRQAAVEGFGLLFATDLVVRDDLDAGRLVKLPEPICPGLSYWALTLPGDTRPEIAAFIAWLEEELAEAKSPAA